MHQHLWLETDCGILPWQAAAANQVSILALITPHDGTEPLAGDLGRTPPIAGAILTKIFCCS